MDALIKQLDDLKNLVQEHDALTGKYQLLQQIVAARNLFVIAFDGDGNILFQNYPHAGGATTLADFKFLLGAENLSRVIETCAAADHTHTTLSFTENQLQFEVMLLEPGKWALYIEMSPHASPLIDSDSLDEASREDMANATILARCLQDLRELLSDNSLDSASEEIRNNHLETIRQCLARTDDPVLRTCLEIIEQNMRDALSHETGIDESLYSLLTPSELQIAEFIRQGKSSKEIANTLKIAAKTVENHRNNLRAKLGIANKGINLRSHLINLSKKTG